MATKKKSVWKAHHKRSVAATAKRIIKKRK